MSMQEEIYRNIVTFLSSNAPVSAIHTMRFAMAVKDDVKGNLKRDYPIGMIAENKVLC